MLTDILDSWGWVDADWQTKLVDPMSLYVTSGRKTYRDRQGERCTKERLLSAAKQAETRNNAVTTDIQEMAAKLDRVGTASNDFEKVRLRTQIRVYGLGFRMGT